MSADPETLARTLSEARFAVVTADGTRAELYTDREPAIRAASDYVRRSGREALICEVVRRVAMTPTELDPRTGQRADPPQIERLSRVVAAGRRAEG